MRFHALPARLRVKWPGPVCQSVMALPLRYVREGAVRSANLLLAPVCCKALSFCRISRGDLRSVANFLHSLSPEP